MNALPQTLRRLVVVLLIAGILIISFYFILWFLIAVVIVVPILYGLWQVRKRFRARDNGRKHVKLTILDKK